MEKAVSDYIDSVLDIYRDHRDLNQEAMFQMIYGSGMLRRFFPALQDETVTELPEQELPDYDKRLAAMETGGHAAGLIRVYMAIARIGQNVKRSHFEMANEIAKTHKVLNKISPAQFKKILHEQTAILQANEEKALNALSVLIKDKDDRMDALSIARRLCLVDGVYTDAEKNMIEKIKKGLKL
jgi:hypothetical protein